MDRLSPQDIRDIHEYMIKRYGGLSGEYESGLIDYMADKPFYGYGEVEFYPDQYTKAAVYMEGFATHQYFCDGNKRTAYMCAKNFLELNGFMLDITDDQLFDMSLAIANKDKILSDIAIWIKTNTYKI